MKKKKIISNIPSIILLFLGNFVLILYVYILFNFANVVFEEIIFTLIFNEGTGGNALGNGLIGILPTAVFITCVMIYTFNAKPRIICNKFILNINNKKIHLFSFEPKRIRTFSIVYFVTSVLVLLSGVHVYKYIGNQLFPSYFIEENYVDPASVEVIFPEEKQNLIYIYVESLENSLLSTINGGYQTSSYIPNLEIIATSNLNFSNSNLVGGALSLTGTTWTAAGMVAQTAGIPIKVDVDLNEKSNLSSSFPGAYSLGEILEKNGYKNYLLLGSDGSFGGRKQYFEEHGNYKVLDYFWAKEEKLIPEDYYVWWGYEDSKLFAFAKNELSTIASKGEPFNFTLLTADTHFTDGYLDKSCSSVFSYQYGNTFYCSDGMITSFIDWVKEQSWSSNTTIVITGDHLTMQKDLVRDPLYTRTVFNAFINPKIEPIQKNNRTFTTLDMYPTTLAALGAKIDGNQLGLGVNLFSENKTLSEKYGIDIMNKEMGKKSMFYIDRILGDTYKEMLLGN